MQLVRDPGCMFVRSFWASRLASSELQLVLYCLQSMSCQLEADPGVQAAPRERTPAANAEAPAANAPAAEVRAGTSTMSKPLTSCFLLQG